MAAPKWKGLAGLDLGDYGPLATVTAFAKRIGVGRDRMSEVIHGRRRITPDTAMRLSLALGTSVQFWLNAQMAADLYEVQLAAKSASLKKIKLVSCAA